MRLKTWAASLAVALTLPFLHGCGNEDANQGQVRLINATSEYATLDLYTLDSSGNDDLVVAGATPGAATAYTGVDKGSYTFDIKSGTGPGVAAHVSGTVRKTDHATVVAYLTGNALQAQYLTDEETAPASGNAKLRILNAASNEAGSVDVYLTTHACNALTVTDTALVAGVAGLQSSFSQVTASAAGTDWHVCVTTAGDKSTLRLDIPKLTLKDQEIATLILTRTAGGVLLQGAVLDQQGSPTAYPSAISRVRVVADAASAGLVSVALNSVSLAGDLQSPSVGRYTTIPSGALTASISINDVAISGVTLPAAASGADYTLLVAGTVGAPSITLITDNNTPSTITAQPVEVRVVNGLNGLSGNPSISASVDGTLVGSATFATASSYQPIAASTGTATVRMNGAPTNAAPLTSQTFSSGSVNTIFILGDAAAPQIFPTADR